MGSSRSVRGTVIKSSTSPKPADGEAAADDARPESAWGSALISWGPFDRIACPAAAACPATPAGLVVGGGDVNGVNVVAAADEPAYPYIAAASRAHISA